MSYMDELRDRFLAAETRFGRINEAGREYRDRLMGLMSRVEEEIRCRRDVERQQAKEIERLTGEIENLSGENEQLRTMMMSLLSAVEAGNSDVLGDTLNEMDTKVATLIGEGQGAATAIPLADETPAEPTGQTPDFSAEMVDEFDEEADEHEEFSAPSFSAGDLMPAPGDAVEDVAAEEDEMPAAMESEPAAADSDPDSDPEPISSDDLAEPAAPMPTAAEGDAATDYGAFYGADDQAEIDAVPNYSNAVAGWEDFLDEDGSSTEAAVSGDAAETTLSEVADNFTGEDAGDPEAGSIQDLIDRAKTAVDGEDDGSGAETASLDSGDDLAAGNPDEDDNGKAAAQ